MKEEIKLRIGEELSRLRIDNNYTIQELSKITDINKDTLYRYEHGLGNCFDTLGKILSAYNLNFKNFLTSFMTMCRYKLLQYYN